MSNSMSCPPNKLSNIKKISCSHGWITEKLISFLSNNQKFNYQLPNVGKILLKIWFVLKRKQINGIRTVFLEYFNGIIN
jgi:hypothetical protein